jgi:hypothetical protein
MALIPDYAAFVKELYAAEVYGDRQYAVEVVRPALRQLGIANLRQAEAGVRRNRAAPFAGEGVDFLVLDSALRRLFARIGRYEAETGVAAIDPTNFIPHRWGDSA